MNSKIIETLETLENKIESIKWLITAPFSFRKTDLSNTINAIRKSAGILDKTSPKGIVFENKMRKGWNTNSFRRVN